MRRAPYGWIALATVACGAVLCVLGWYGVSGERFTARQVPYLASCTLPGAALIVAGAVLLAGRGRDGGWRDGGWTDRGWLDAEPPFAEAEEAGHRLPSSDGPLLRLPGGTLAHRPDCPLVLGKAEAEPAPDVRDLAPCPVCEPTDVPVAPHVPAAPHVPEEPCVPAAPHVPEEPPAPPSRYGPGPAPTSGG